MALEPSYLLLLAGKGRSHHQGDWELAGHKTITMSARYNNLSPEHRLSVIDRIASKAVDA